MDKPKDNSKEDEADSPPQKKVKLESSAPGTPSTGRTSRATAGTSSGSDSGGAVAKSTDGLPNTTATPNCNSIPSSKVRSHVF